MMATQKAENSVEFLPLAYLTTLNVLQTSNPLEFSEEILLQLSTDKPVSIISIIGPPGSGKSLVLRYLVKYLMSLEQEISNWMDWDSPEKELVSIKWKGSLSRTVPAIWISSHPFSLKLDDENASISTAVFLVYAQTLEVNNWMVDQNLKNLMGLVILHSSCIIFNAAKTVDEKYLSGIKEFISSGFKHVNPKQAEQKIQSAVFLIRDWNFPTEFPYGVTGGTKFMKEEKLRPKPNHSRSSLDARKLIKSKVKSLSGCMLPFPGPKVHNSSFDGRLSHLNDQFGKSVQEFINRVFRLNGFPVLKDCNDQPMTFDNFRILLTHYVFSVNNGNGDSINKFTGEILEENDGVLTKFECKNLVRSAAGAYSQTLQAKYKERPYLLEAEIDKQNLKAKKAANAALKHEFYKLIYPPNDSEDDELVLPPVLLTMLKRKISEIYKIFLGENLNSRQNFIAEYILKICKQYEDTMSKIYDKATEKTTKYFLDDLQDEIENLKDEFMMEAWGTKKSPEMMDENEENEISHLLIQLQVSQTNIKLKLEKNFEWIKSTDSRNLHENTTTESPTFETASSNSISSSLSFQDAEDLFKEDEDDVKGNVFDGQLQEQRMSIPGKNYDDTENLEAVNWPILKMDNNVSPVLEQVVLDCPSKSNVAMYSTQYGGSSFSSSNCKDSVTETLINQSLNIASGFTEAQIEENLSDKVKIEIKSYMDKLSAKLLNRYASEEELEDLHKQAVQELLKKPEHVEPKCNSTLKVPIQQLLDIQFLELKASNNQRRLAAIRDSKALLTACQNEYTEIMRQKREMQVCLNEAHKTALNEVLETFKRKSPIRSHKSLFIAELSSLTDRLEQMQKLLISCEVEQQTSKIFESSLKNALVIYNEEMDKQCSGAEPFSNEKLKKQHDFIKHSVVKRTFHNLQVTRDQTAKIEETFNMAFRKFEEINQMRSCEDIAIGIDLGTTFCCVSAFINGQIRIIPNSVGNLTTPSYVQFQPNGGVVVGEEAKSSAYEKPETTVYDAKRIIGEKFDDQHLQKDLVFWPFSVVDNGKGTPCISVDGNLYYPEEISGILLSHLKVDAEKYLKREVTKAVITVPAYFKEGQRQATIDAGRMAGLNVLAILNEPVAAAMAFKLQDKCVDHDEEKFALIFDLGGGTFDVAILRIKNRQIEVIALGGDTHLGGTDFDRNLMKYCADEFKNKHNINIFDNQSSNTMQLRDAARRQLNRLLAECERQKICLTQSPQVHILLQNFCDDRELEVPIKREQFEEINKDLFSSILKSVENVLNQAQLDKSKVDEIILVGGSTRIPKISQMLREFFEFKSLNKKINPTEVVAYGAGLHAAVLNGQIKRGSDLHTRIQDITPLSIGIEVHGGNFSIVIPKGTKIPVKLHDRYRTTLNNQTSVQITILQGESTIATENSKLGDFFVKGIPSKNAGEENIDVEMTINSQGILHVTARSESSGALNTRAISVIEVKNRLAEKFVIETGKTVR